MNKELNELIAFITQNYSHLPAEAKPLIPYMILKYIAANYIDSYIPNFGLHDSSGESSQWLRTTSCVNSTALCLSVFAGRSKTSIISEQLNTSGIMSLGVSAHSEKIWEYTIHGLFDGGVVREMTQHNCNLDKNLLPYLDPYINPYDEYFQPIIDKAILASTSSEDIIAKLKQTLDNVHYDFNDTTFTLLKNDITHSAENTAINKSHVYVIGIRLPDKNENIDGSFEHVFLIEQFYLYHTNEVRYRIYQSWKNKSTLLEDMVKQNYGEQGENALTEEEIFQFIENFRELYSLKPHRPMTHLDCFGYSCEKTPLTFFDGSNLKGISVRYISSAIDPNDCIQNVIDCASKLTKQNKRALDKSDEEEENVKTPRIN